MWKRSSSRRDSLNLMAYLYAHGTLHRLAPTSSSSRAAVNDHVAGIDHAEYGFLFEAVGAFGAGDGILHGQQRDGTFYADAFRSDGQIIVMRIWLVSCCIMCCAVGLRVGGGVWKPGRGVGHGRGVVAGELGVVDEFLEADVVVVLGVAGDCK